jgi:hypothetical protein
MLFFLPLPVMAVETVIVGEIVNETTGEAIPNVNIHFRGTKIGTSSDANGNYALRVDMTGKAQLVFSAVGYYTQRFDIEPGTMAGLQVAMRERAATLTEIVVAPNENPALAILRQVRVHREENDRTMHEERGNTMRREQTLYVSHIGKRHLRRALWKSLQAGMIAQEDSTYILPLYRERQTFRLSGAEMIPANDQQTQALILTETDYSSLIGSEGNLNFYASSVSLMGHAFLSPLAASGNLYYRYYIDDIDSTAHDFLPNGVKIVFRTRNPFYATFNGEMIIDTTSYALRALKAYVPAEVAVNYVNNLHVTQILAEDGRLEEESISVLLDFAIKSEKAGSTFPTLLLNTRMTSSARSSRSASSTSSSSSTSFSGFSSPAADSAFAAIDSLPVIRAAKWFATIATTGYIPTGTMVDIGHVEEILQVNKHEGVHIGLPFRTNEKLSKVVSLEASVGYGFKDRSPKGMGRISVNLPTPRKNILQIEYNDRYVWSEVDDFDRLLRENSMGWGNMDFTAYAFEALHRDRRCVNTAMRQRQLQLHWFSDWGEHIAAGKGHPISIESHLYARAGWQPTVLPALQEGTEKRFAYQSLSAIVRMSWGERKYDGYFMRRYAYSSRYPVLYLGAEAGHWSAEESKVYFHFRALLTQHAHLGMGGTLSYALQAGMLFGKVPQTLLWQADANQGYAYDPYRFTLLHGNQLLATRYATLQAEWNGMGILFNLIPGIRWLHLRELVEAKIAYGYNSQAESGMQRSLLYSEVGIGIGNILRVCDLYSVWSLSPEIQWAMRFRIHLGL